MYLGANQLIAIMRILHWVLLAAFATSLASCSDNANSNLATELERPLYLAAESLIDRAAEDFYWYQRNEAEDRPIDSAIYALMKRIHANADAFYSFSSPFLVADSVYEFQVEPGQFEELVLQYNATLDSIYQLIPTEALEDLDWLEYDHEGSSTRDRHFLSVVRMRMTVAMDEAAGMYNTYASTQSITIIDRFEIASLPTPSPDPGMYSFGLYDEHFQRFDRTITIDTVLLNGSLINVGNSIDSDNLLGIVNLEVAEPGIYFVKGTLHCKIAGTLFDKPFYHQFYLPKP